LWYECRWSPWETREALALLLLKKTADEVNRVAESLKAHKLRVGYHNHTTDFNRIDGEYWWNRFADLTSKDVMNPNAYLGADELDWPAIMTAAEGVGGIEWYIIEYEKEGVPPLESLKAIWSCSRSSG
jgi:hypothetical protein